MRATRRSPIEPSRAANKSLGAAHLLHHGGRAAKISCRRGHLAPEVEHVASGQISLTVSSYFFREGLLGNNLQEIADVENNSCRSDCTLRYRRSTCLRGAGRFQRPPNRSRLGELTDARIEIVKAALQLTPDQEKLWPPIEDAIRARAKDRQARIAIAAERVRELRDRSRIEVLRDRNPIEFMKKRADRLAQRSADLKRLAEAWEPLYQTLTPEQRRRMAFLAIIAVREMRDAVEDRRVRSEDDDDE